MSTTLMGKIRRFEAKQRKDTYFRGELGRVADRADARRSSRVRCASWSRTALRAPSNRQRSWSHTWRRVEALLDDLRCPLIASPVRRILHAHGRAPRRTVGAGDAPAPGATACSSYALVVSSPTDAGWRRWIWHSFFASVALLIVGLIVSLAVTGTTTEQPRPVEIFIQTSASLRQVDSIRQMVEAIPGVGGCAFWSRQRDYHEAVSLLPIQGTDFLTPQRTPASWRCTYTPPATLNEIFGRLVHVAGVYEIVGGNPVATISSSVRQR